MTDPILAMAHDPRNPQTGGRRRDYSAATNLRVSKAVARFKEIYVPYPLHTELHARCDYLMKLGQETRGRPQLGMRVLAPSGSGKTTAAEALMRLIEAKHPRTTTCVPVVYVSLEKAATSKKLMVSILDFFGDAYSIQGNELILKRRALACFERFGTRLLIIDEVHHLSLSRGTGNDVTDSLKRFLDDGVIPIVFLGTEDGAHLFTRNVQLSSRLVSPMDLRVLRSDRAADVELMAAFVHSLDRAIVERGLLPEYAGLRDPWIQGCLHHVSGGVIGRVSRLLALALESALRRGADRIEVFDLSLASDEWAVAHQIIHSNPFLRGAP